MTNIFNRWSHRYGRFRWIVRIGMLIGGWLLSRRRTGQPTNVIQGQNNRPQ